MTAMPKEMRTQADLLRTKIRADVSGLLFVQASEPKMLLSFKIDSPDLQNEIRVAIRKVFSLSQNRDVDVLLAAQEDGDLIWTVTPAFERVLQVA